MEVWKIIVYDAAGNLPRQSWDINRVVNRQLPIASAVGL